jgi:Flp pilus assembly protein TadG
MGTVHRSPGSRASKRGERGQSAVELGILLPIFLLLIVGVVEVNSALNSYITVVTASRDGARLGSKGAATSAAIQALVQKDLGRLPNTTPASNITITFPTVASMTSVKVQACYDHTTLMSVPILMPDSFHMCASTTMPKLN